MDTGKGSNVTMKYVITLLVVGGLTVITALGLVYSGAYDVSAMTPHGDFANWLLSTTAHRSVARRASGIDAPVLDDETLIVAGINDYDAMCVDCHGAPGRALTPMGEGLNPPPPDLSESAQHLSDAELFWVTKHGIRMTGMPAWGKTHADEDLWPLVAFLRRLPDLDAEQYEALLASATGAGHHDDAAHSHSPAEEAQDHDHAAPAAEATNHDEHSGGKNAGQSAPDSSGHSDDHHHGDHNDSHE